jgi:M6 family metalloprotease-like protein
MVMSFVRTCSTRNRRIAVLVAFLLAFSLSAIAAPTQGTTHQLKQPNGSTVTVRIWGDEYHQVVESLDGYALMRHPGTGLICYARLSKDGTRLESTGVVAEARKPAALKLAKHLRISKPAMRAAVRKQRSRLSDTPFYAATTEGDTEGVQSGPSMGAPSQGNVKAITLIIDFPDEAGTISPSEVDNFCNQPGYTGYGNYGSVRDYFYDVSDGNLSYTNYVSPTYYTAQNPKSYYDNSSESCGPKARELVIEALDWIEAQGHDFSQYDANGDGRIDGINVLYAGNCGSGWAKGLWPHSWTVYWSADGVSTYKYQITDMSSSLTLRTFCHENGHMICYWPDLYDYDYDSRGVGKYCLMGYGTYNTNPGEPGAYLRAAAGWCNVVELDGSPRQGLVATQGMNLVYKYTKPGASNEYYMIENRYRTGRDSGLPDSGLAIWHVDEYGSNNNQQMTDASHYECTLVQADGAWDMENNRDYGDSADLFGAPGDTECSATTSPNTNWWDGGDSGLKVSSISVPGTVMTFNIGDTQNCVLSVESVGASAVAITGTTPGTTPYTATVDDETTVTLTAPATHTDAGTDYEFVRWLLDGAGQTNGVHDLTLVMERDATVSAEYAIVSRTLTVQSTPISAVTITGTAGSGGTTDYTAAIPDHTTITLTAPASLDDSSYAYTFSHWKLDGQDQQAGKTDVTVTLEANAIAIAVYTEEAKAWTLTILAPEGSGTTVPGTGSHSYDIFTDASATATAATGWHLVRWEGTAVVAGQEADNPITIAAGIADETKTLKAVFAEDALPQEEIVDNTDTGASKSFEAVSGTWKPSTYESGYYGSNYAYASASAGAETARARWQCTTLAAGTYEVYVRWSGSSSRASNAPYVIKNGDTELATARVDQRPSGSEWFLLGTYAFDAGAHKVELHNGATSGQYITADAVRFLQTDDTPPPPADKGSLSITLTPAEAIAVGAQWRVNGSAWQDSGATVADLNVGNAAVEYQAVVGYTAPAAETATITKDTTTALARTYTVAVPVSEEIIDNTDTGASKSFEVVSGTWKSSTYVSGYYGSNYAFASASAGAETARARWQCTTLAAGTYEVYVRWSGASSRASNAPYVIKNGDTELATVRVDQRPSGSEWFLLGTYAFDAGSHKVELHNGATTGQYITADAVRFLQTDDTPPPPADKGSLTITLTPAEAIAVGAQWRVNGSAWQDSGATVADLNVGNAAVEYQVVVGYTAPAAETATITKDTTTALARTYTVAVPVSEEIIDNTDTGASKSFEVVSGTWKSSTYESGYYGSNYAFASASAGAETARARWSCSTLAAGTYEVYVRWSGSSSRASNAPYVIKNGDTELATARVDQRPSGSEWFLLGTYAFDAGSHKVELHNGATTGQYITADAVRFVSVGGGG